MNRDEAASLVRRVLGVTPASAYHRNSYGVLAVLAQCTTREALLEGLELCGFTGDNTPPHTAPLWQLAWLLSYSPKFGDGGRLSRIEEMLTTVLQGHCCGRDKETPSSPDPDRIPLPGIPKTVSSGSLSTSMNHGKGPREVQVGFSVQNIYSIDTVEQTFTARFKVFTIWREPSLIGKQAKDVNFDDLPWKPRTYIKNAMNLDITEARVRPYDINSGGTVRGVIEEGYVIETIRYRGTLSTTFYLEEFPCDNQELSIIMTTRDHTKKAVFLESPRQNVLEAQSLHGWHFRGFHSRIQTGEQDNNDNVCSEYHIVVDAQRLGRYYLFNVAGMLFLLVTMAFFTMAMEPKAYGERAGHVTTLLLTVVAFKHSIGDSLPKISYLTRLDCYVIACFSFLVAVSFENFLAALALKCVSDWEGWEETVVAYDFRVLAVLAAAWLVFNVANVDTARRLNQEREYRSASKKSSYDLTKYQFKPIDEGKQTQGSAEELTAPSPSSGDKLACSTDSMREEEPENGSRESSPSQAEKVSGRQGQVPSP